MSERVLTRRHFIRISAVGGGGLLLAMHVPNAVSELHPQERDDVRFNTFVTIRGDGSVEVKIPVPEIGQGVRTSLAMLVAEELDVPWEAVRVVQADAEDGLGPSPRAAGSQSVRANWLPLREAGATARAALVGAAAARWGVDPRGCTTNEGHVLHEASGRRASYGGLAHEAADRDVPSDVMLKDESEFRLIGTDRRHLDTPRIVTGEILFGMDVAVPGMLRAVIARCPTYGGRVRGYDETAALRVAGVRRVVEVAAVGGTEDRPYSVEGLAVVAESTWAAMEGRRALAVDWDHGPNTNESTDRLHRICQDLISRPAAPYTEEGDLDRAMAAADRTVEAVYHAPFLAHAPMEPMNCVAHVREDGAEIWAPTQIPIPAWQNVANRLEMDPDDVVVHVTRIGGGFGRRLSVDFLMEAIQVAQAVDAPVHVMWSRSDDMRHGFFRPFSYHRLEASIDGDGRLTGWLHRQSGTSRYAFREDQHPGASEFRAGSYPAALVPAYRLEYALAPSNLPVGPLRAPGFNSYAFAVESFIDEVALAAGRDPLELRLELLDRPRTLPDWDNDVFDTTRMRRVLEVAARAAGWGSPLPEGRGRGIGIMATFGSYAAQVAEVSVDRSTGDVTVHQVTCAVDCGRAVNPNGVRAQMESGIIDGLSAAMFGEITVTDGMVDQSNFTDYPILRYDQCPRIDVHIIPSQAPPTGAGETPYPPMFPALTNAIFAASGARVRSLPARPQRVVEALRAVSTGVAAEQREAAL